jgi:hypothetical protein
LFFCSLFLGILFTNCTKNNPVTDVDQLAALRNVTFTYDSAEYQFSLPVGAFSGKSFAQLVKEDSATYSNPANYSINFSADYTASNKTSNARDAKFDGMVVNIVFDTINSSTVKAIANSFEVIKNTSVPVQVKSTLNLGTQRKAGIYIFRQVVAGNDIVTTQTPIINYKIGTLQGTITLPSFKENIPTRASAGTKAFLKGLLDSGMFN